MDYNKFGYFLNAILYSIWLSNIKFGEIMGWTVDKLLSPITKYLFTKEHKRKIDERLLKNKKKTDLMFYDKEMGFHIKKAKYWFGYFYSGYPSFLSFAYIGFIMRVCDNLSSLMILAIFAIPIGLCYIPAYMAVFSNDRYLNYFKQFEKEDARWHRKWKWITIAFCLGSVIATILGICAAFSIAIM